MAAWMWPYPCQLSPGVLARIFAIGGALCIINNLGVWSIMGVVNYTCVSCKLKQSITKVSQRPAADFIW